MEISLLTTPTVSGTLLGRKARAWCTSHRLESCSYEIEQNAGSWVELADLHQSQSHSGRNFLVFNTERLNLHRTGQLVSKEITTLQNNCSLLRREKGAGLRVALTIWIRLTRLTGTTVSGKWREWQQQGRFALLRSTWWWRHVRTAWSHKRVVTAVRYSCQCCSIFTFGITPIRVFWMSIFSVSTLRFHSG